jgi:4-hydroxymandelate oxidase
MTTSIDFSFDGRAVSEPRPRMSAAAASCCRKGLAALDSPASGAWVRLAFVALVNLADYEARAREVVSGSLLDYYDGGAHDAITLRENAAAFGRSPLYPRVFRGSAQREATTTAIGFELSMPVIVAPVALVGMAYPDAEAVAARAASAAGSIYVLSTFSTVPVERVVEAAPGRVWFQLYVYRDRAATEALVKRVEEAGCTALDLTADAPILGERERDVRNSFELPEGLWAPNLSADAAHVPAKPEGVSPFAAAFDALVDPGLTWDDVAWLKSVTTLPVLVKGIVRADDAVRAVEAGASGVVVSNHGGRQLDTAPATIDVLAAITEAVGDRAEILVDGGIRRGTDIVKAIALGASAVQVGRPMLWGLVVDGEEGVAQVLTILQREFDHAMALCGCRSVAEITPDLVQR